MLANLPDEVASAFAGGGGKNPSYTLGLIIPPGFDASLQRGEHPQVRLYFNSSQVTDLQRQRVVTLITDYASGESHALPLVIITPTTSLPTTSLYTMDLSTFYLTLALLTSILADLLHGRWLAGCLAGQVPAWQYLAGHRYHSQLDGRLSDRCHPLAPSPDDGHCLHLT